MRTVRDNLAAEHGVKSDSTMPSFLQDVLSCDDHSDKCNSAPYNSCDWEWKKKLCPAKCGLCCQGDCCDAQSFMAGDVVRNCDWVNEDRAKRCRLYSNSCPETCDTCRS